MLAVVIPARNEAAQIQAVIRQALRTSADLVIPVLNGCDDMTSELIRRMADKRIRPLLFHEPLGYDVPRIAGVRAALDAGATAVLFVDGDLSGPITAVLVNLAAKLRREGVDLALSDCYADTAVPSLASAANRVYQTRMELNRALGRSDLGPAIPSHGPVGASRRLLTSVPLVAIGVPPLLQAYAVLAGLRVEIGARIAHRELGSTKRDREHRLRIADTIIGDCLQATCLAHGRPLDRQGRVGYHHERRFDLVGLDRRIIDGGGRWTKASSPVSDGSHLHSSPVES